MEIFHKINDRELKYTQTQENIFNLARSFFKDEKGNEIHLTPNQCTIFDIIWSRKYKQTHLMAHTRFGKSMTVALAVLLRIATFPEKWSIIAPNMDKARIIMDYIIQHAFDHEYFKAKLSIEKGESLESLRRKRTKDKINFKHTDDTLGEVFIIGVDSNNKVKAGEAAMGFGAPNVILDEAALVDDETEGKVFRMLADNASDYFYCKIGNPFKRNHFLKDFRDPTIYHLNLDAKMGLSEGRLTEEFLHKAKEKPNYDILFDNKFPAADLVDNDGWSVLLTDDEIENAMVKYNVPMFGTKRLGIDISEGSENFNAFTVRSENFAFLARKDKESNMVMSIGNLLHIKSKLDIEETEVYYDGIGIGVGFGALCQEKRVKANSVKVSTQALDGSNFANLRAEAYWSVREWIKQGGKLKYNLDWYQLTDIRYKVNGTGKLLMMSKDEMKKKYNVESPDVADSLMLTFAFPKKLSQQRQVQKRVKRSLIKRENKQSLHLRMA